jgi:hypothetical protein
MPQASAYPWRESIQPDAPAGKGRYNPAMPMSRDESIELRHLYDRFSLAVERASATMHMRGMDSVAFRVEDGKCVALWSHIRALMEKANEPASQL